MSELIKKNYWNFRPLLTETLPYELPVIFSNDIFYFSRCRVPDENVEPLLKKLFFRPKQRQTIPYNYQIRKDRNRFTLLSLVHPFSQIDWCEFYVQYENSLLAYCDRSEFSLRRPSAVAAVYVSEIVEGEVQKTGSVHLAPDGREPEISRMVSYFAYEKFNLLSKFFESKEFVRLEKRFSVLRQVDVSKCFYSIYTHALGWAIKGKEFTKANLGAHTFEARFDALMQQANYNETNGIVVGPEISRVFAEIILQDADHQIQSVLSGRQYRLFEGMDYAIRRYVDDYSIFANSSDTLDVVERVVRDVLEKYKLYINENKVRNFERPFVSSLSLARGEIRERLAAVRKILVGAEWLSGGAIREEQKKAFGRLVDEFRSIVKRYSIEFGNISGSVVGELRALIRQAGAGLKSGEEHSARNWLVAIRGFLDCAFYVASVDLRVRTTYSLCQLLSNIFREREKVSSEIFAIVEGLIAEELLALARTASASARAARESVELFNVLICGAHFMKTSFLRNGKIKALFNELLASDLTYFKYISLKHCFLQDRVFYAAELDQINRQASNMLIAADDVRSKSELFHLLCDYLSAPDISDADKCAKFVQLFGGAHSAAEVAKLGQCIGFVDWEGVSIEHLLRRRQMRPVYALA